MSSRRLSNIRLQTSLAISFGTLLLLVAAITVVAALGTQGTAHTVVVACGVLGIVLGSLVAGWSMLLVTAPIHDTLAIAGRITSGDLSGSVEVSTGGEIGQLMQALQEMHARMFRIVSEVRSGTTTVASTSSQISRDNEALSQRTQTQAGALEETAASIGQLTSTVRQNADNALQANALVLSASHHAIRGGEVMTEVVRMMGSIRGSSHRIADVIGVIDAIAFQTNILALNAAVEAARAGEQGRGFAVVAAEVRRLAQRAASAASEIKSLIGDSVRNVDAGGKLVDDAGRTMEEVVASVRQVEAIMGQINTASQEQSVGIGSINRAVAQIDRMTRSNAMLVEDATRSATALNEQAVSLLRTVAGFDLGDREYGTLDEAVAMVRRACAFVTSHGSEALVADVNKTGKGRFIDRDLYLMVLRVDDGMLVAHGNNQRTLGMGAHSTDVTGKHFLREMADTGRTRDEGWVDHKWAHPVTNEIRAKRSFLKRAGDVVVICGIYKD